jgi:hypothetical protein
VLTFFSPAKTVFLYGMVGLKTQITFLKL